MMSILTPPHLCLYVPIYLLPFYPLRSLYPYWDSYNEILKKKAELDLLEGAIQAKKEEMLASGEGSSEEKAKTIQTNIDNIVKRIALKVDEIAAMTQLGKVLPLLITQLPPVPWLRTVLTPPLVLALYTL